MKKKCPQCGKEFENRASAFCSSECNEANLESKIKKDD